MSANFRLPMAADTALTTAGAIGGRPGSPVPVGKIEMRAHAWTSYGQPEWAVAAGLFASCHWSGLQLFVGNLAEEVNRMGCFGEVARGASAN